MPCSASQARRPRFVEGRNADREVVHIGAGGVRFARNEVDQAGPGAQLHQADFLQPPLLPAAEHAGVEGYSRVHVADPEHDMVQMTDAKTHGATLPLAAAAPHIGA